MTTQISRFSSLGVHLRTLNDFTNVQGNLNILQGQISSGYKADTFDGLGTQVEHYSGVKAVVVKLDVYSTNNTQTISRLQTVSQSLDNLIEVANDIQDLITQRRSPSFPDRIAFGVQMEDMRKAVALQLNASNDGRYMFGGTRTDTPPVITDPAVPNSVEPGIPDDNYYQGSKQNFSTRIQDNQVDTYNIRADNAAFQKLFAGISAALSANNSTQDDLMTTAYDLVHTSIQEIIGLQTQTNARIVNLNEVNERNVVAKTYFKGIGEAIAKTDLVAASTQVASDQALLQATFQVFGKISSLHLNDYLR